MAGVAEDVANPCVELIGSAVGAAGECAEEDGGCFERLAGGETGAKGAGIGIEAEDGFDVVAGAMEGDAGATAELDAGEPTRVRRVGVEDEFCWNDFAGFAWLREGVGGGFAGPGVALGDVFKVRADG